MEKSLHIVVKLVISPNIVKAKVKTMGNNNFHQIMDH